MGSVIGDTGLSKGHP